MIEFFRTCSLIHLATHGIFTSFEIDGPSIESIDAFTVQDVYDMYLKYGPLSPYLVVLNTCMTCTDPDNSGEVYIHYL